MVCIEILDRLRRSIEDNLEIYEKERPGEFVLAEMNEGVIIRTFHKRKSELEKAVKKVEDYYYFSKIPTHRFKEGNETILYSDKYIGVCPNDRKTKLGVGELHSHSDDKGNPVFREHVYCPDCNCLVYRKLSSKRLKQLKNLGVCSGEVTFP